MRRKSWRRHAHLVAVVCVLLGCAQAQRLNLEPRHPGEKPVPTVTFEFASRRSTPAYYAIAVQSTGRAAFREEDVGPGNGGARGVPYQKEFTVSAAIRAQIFALARQADYFQENLQSAHGGVATGIKTLFYSEGPSSSILSPTVGVRNSATYTSSDQPAVQQLTQMFESLYRTLELGRRLEYFRRVDPTLVTGELKRAEASAMAKRLPDLQAITPALRAVTEDRSLAEAARQRARRLLLLAQPQAS